MIQNITSKISDPNITFKKKIFPRFFICFSILTGQWSTGSPRIRAPNVYCAVVNLLNVYILQLIWVENGCHSSARSSGP